MIEKIGEFFISTFERSRGEPRSPPLHTGAPPHAPTLAEPVHERILRRSAIARTHCRTRVRSPCPRTRCSLQSHRTNCALCTPLRSMRAPNARAPHASQVVCMETCSSRSTSRSWGGRRVKVCRSPPHRTLSRCAQSIISSAHSMLFLFCFKIAREPCTKWSLCSPSICH